MVTLNSILEDAEIDPYLENSTVLDEDQFFTIRAPSSRCFRDRIDAALDGSGDLAQIQQLNAKEGLEVIEPVQAGIHGGYWYLRNLTHKGETFPAGESQYKSIVEALLAAIEWWQGESWCRGVMVRKYDVNQAHKLP